VFIVVSDVRLPPAIPLAPGYSFVDAGAAFLLASVLYVLLVCCWSEVVALVVQPVTVFVINAWNTNYSRNFSVHPDGASWWVSP